MSVQIPEHYQPDFADNFDHLLQQNDSRLEGKTRVTAVKGKERTFSQIGTSQMRLITTRNGTTVPSNTPMAKRWLRTKAYDEVSHIDEFDDVALGELPSPQGDFVMSHMKAAKRQMDQVIIDALEGTSYIGENGTTEVALGASQQVAVDFVNSGSTVNSGLTLAKILRAKFILDSNEVPDEGRYFLYSAKQLNDLLNDVEEVKSSDYVQVKSLIDGKIREFAGFEWVRLELLTLDTATDIRTCIAYGKDCIAFGEGKGRSVKISIRDDINETVQVRTKMLIGATRLEEEGVVLVYTDESP